jgi:hypothetical protein
VTRPPKKWVNLALPGHGPLELSQMRFNGAQNLTKARLYIQSSASKFLASNSEYLVPVLASIGLFMTKLQKIDDFAVRGHGSSELSQKRFHGTKNLTKAQSHIESSAAKFSACSSKYLVYPSWPPLAFSMPN